MKKIILIILTGLCVLTTGCKKNQKAQIVASTSWTAAFADIAGAENVQIIAPASLQHPPEYEITVSDLQKVQQSELFIYAGFERMMKTIGDSVEAERMIKITCDNSIKTVGEESKKIARLLGTEELWEKRIAEYIQVIEEGRKIVQETGLSGARVLCNKNQRFLAGELGLEVEELFGPGPVTSGQIANAKNGDYVLIIDNIHNPVGQPLAEVSPESKYLVWRNFPENTERGALAKVVKDNIDMLGEKL